ncbi:probable LRR receptor-like serine/threonine-protein kinase At1g56140 isoform X1 [Cannabis sativa]|uniref:probable LRR receptor-like serine/threonine-protein kinase At1g56140 isoform X1 n=2 Tax=Cannabis sativa TaxID=3483 RepID=UPI0011DF2D20|nr:probable LRR receptor-like serine/threonine-protein kinase At1g56140 isoform X1 [Cannabis sativa]
MFYVKYNIKWSLLCCSFIVFFLICLTPHPSMAQTQNATTDLSEVRALNTLFGKWGIKPNTTTWNISGNPCSGTAIDDNIKLEDMDNPGIKCNCTYDNNNTCHITHLRVQRLELQGTVPEEITAFKFLKYLKINLNHFEGTLPAFFGNFSLLEQIDVGHNTFHGAVPKELGNLKNLNMLALGSNNFSGPLPAEIGNLLKLEQIYIDSSGISGEFPPTFANLKNMQILNTLDTPLSGKIPDFIGNWTRLTNLTFVGNSLQGPIPSSFSQLTSLTSIKIGDLSNGSSSLDFVKNLKNLTELILRNALISGSIPPFIGELKGLKTVDLSFNNLTGKIPPELFAMGNLTNLFLGNNSLTGGIPNDWRDNLVNIDLSYNFLSGRLPRWLGSISQLNLVANNFIFDDSNKSVSPGLYCLQRSFPCNRNTPIHTSFAIKCGGPQMLGNDGIVYEAEEIVLGPAKFHVSGKENWGVSKVGLYGDKTGKLDIEGTQEQVTSTNEKPEFFHTARMSPGSLRYYGLGLVNGPYTVTLHFAEIGFPSQSTNLWASLAKRVFDIYIQGRRLEKDFDISKKAGGVLKAIQMKYNVNVTENYIEIHLFWAGKGTCCIPKEGYYGPLIAAVHAEADFKVSKGENKKKTGIIIGTVVPIMVVGLALLLLVFYKRRKYDEDDNEELLGIGPKPDTFSYAELRAATGDFSSANKLGEGGFGHVYKGTLSDGKEVAVKQLSVASNHGKGQFMAEIATISVVQHRNLVKLYGCCIQGNRRILVYEYLHNRSLDQALFGKNNLHLDWPTRFNICLGIARGLAYLHEESSPRIVHRDVKASNILLDDALCPKISDFGLAKLYDDNKTHMSTRVAGTIGYLAPEYAMRGHLTEKADIFGFGVVALEIVSGKPNFYNEGNESIYLLERVWNLHENYQSLELVDPSLAEFDEKEAIRIIRVALLCTQGSPLIRPSMSRVIGMLIGDSEIENARSKPSYLTDMDYKDTTTMSTMGFSSETYTPGSSNDNTYIFN